MREYTEDEDEKQHTEEKKQSHSSERSMYSLFGRCFFSKSFAHLHSTQSNASIHEQGRKRDSPKRWRMRTTERMAAVELTSSFLCMCVCECLAYAGTRTFSTQSDWQRLQWCAHEMLYG